MEGLSVLDMIRQGALVTYPLIVMSMVVLTIIGERLWALRGLVSGTLRVAGSVVGQLQRGDFKAALVTVQQNQKAPGASKRSRRSKAASGCSVPSVSARRSSVCWAL